MLVDITPRPASDIDPIAKMIAEMGGRGDEHLPRRVSQGVWLFGGWNPKYEIVDEIDDSLGGGPQYDKNQTEEERNAAWRSWMDAENARYEALFDRYRDQYKIEIILGDQDEEDLPPVPEGFTRRIGMPSEYGVCDSVEQFLAMTPHLADDPEAYFVAMVELRREHQSESGGWRWHKWGPYIGTQKREHEYLYDEKHIDVVYTFHVYRLKKTAEEALRTAGYEIKVIGDKLTAWFSAEVAGVMTGEILGPFTDRETMLAAVYEHNAVITELQAAYNLEQEGYRIYPMGDNWHTSFKTTALGGFPNKADAIRYCVNHKRKKKQEESANG